MSERIGVSGCPWLERVSFGGGPVAGFGIGGVFRYEGLRLPGLDGPSNLIIAASPQPPPPPPQPQDTDDGDLGLGKGFNLIHVIGAPVRLAGHALAPLARAAGKTGIPQWTNRHLIKPIIDPALKEAALVSLAVESDGIGVLLNTFIPTPVKELLFGLRNVAVDEIKRGIQGLKHLAPKEIVDTMIRALTFLGSATTVIDGLIYAAFEVGPKYLPYLFANWSAPPGKTLTQAAQGKLAAAQSAFNNDVPQPLKGMLTSVVSMIADIANSGKIRQSDLRSIVGNSKVVDAIMDLFGIHDDPPPDVIAAIKAAPPADQKLMTAAARAATFVATTENAQAALEAAQAVLLTKLAAGHPILGHRVGAPRRVHLPPPVATAGKYEPYPKATT